MSLPTIRFQKLPAGVAAPTAGVTLAVYAPFGTDAVLSRYPGQAPLSVAQHPLVLNLRQVADCGVHVSALVDLVDDDTWLVEIDALKGASPRFTSRWKQQMSSWRTLAGFLRHTRSRRPGTAVVVALEGHGAGFLPELDVAQLDSKGLTQGGSVEWELTVEGASPLLPMGSPLLPMGSPLLPMGSPLLPVDHMPLTTWGLAQGLAAGTPAGAAPYPVLHFDNCFNMSVELLHTVAVALAGQPVAEWAAGYMNYNFFTAGAAYPLAFARLRNAGSATSEQLARWLAQGNADVLASKRNHPTTGGVVALSRLPGILTRLNALADALTAALAGATASARPAVVEKIRKALEAAQQYDTLAPQRLDVPDELVDVLGMAQRFTRFDVNAAAVQGAAKNLVSALSGIKAYGASDAPWTSPGTPWDFTSPDLAMNLLCPDPGLLGWWDWRSPYYLHVLPSAVQPRITPFQASAAWARFVIEYHRDAPFKGLRPAAIPDYPVFDRTQKDGVPIPKR
jgi:hypothetical protein